MGIAINKTIGLTLQNKSGQSVLKGDTVIIDDLNQSAFTITGSVGLSTNTIGVVLDTSIANNGLGFIAIGGFIPQINLLSGAVLGDTFGLSSVAGKAMPHATILSGDFGQVAEVGITPKAILWGNVQVAPGHSYYDRLAGLLEPDCIETILTGTASLVIGANETKYLLASYWTRIGASGRFEVRDPNKPVALRNVTLTGLDVSSIGIISNPGLATYINSFQSYYDKLKIIDDLSLKTVSILGPSKKVLFLAGPYGNIITRVVNFDFTWVLATIPNLNLSYNLANEIGDSASDYQRNDNALLFPVNKKTISSISSGLERTAGAGLATVSHVILPSTYSNVLDTTVYQFRDDFMASSLDGAKWTSTGSTVIDTNFQWVKMIGDNVAWGNTGLYGKTSFTRISGTAVTMDIMPTTGTSPNLIVGWSDGLGQSFSNMAHGIDFTVTGSVNVIQIFENGTNRGTIVGSTWTAFTTYRVRVTLLGANNAALYEIQGGSQFPPIGGAVWRNITPGTSSSVTTPIYPGAVIFTNVASYIGDIKVT